MGFYLCRPWQSGRCSHADLQACQQHGRLTYLTTPEDFSARAPDGGCTEPCRDQLPCGHACRLCCHAYDRSHERVLCHELVYSFCPAGHLVSRRCSAPEAACATCVEIQRVQALEKVIHCQLCCHRLRGGPFELHPTPP